MPGGTGDTQKQTEVSGLRTLQSSLKGEVERSEHNDHGLRRDLLPGEDG